MLGWQMYTLIHMQADNMTDEMCDYSSLFLCYTRKQDVEGKNENRS